MVDEIGWPNGWVTQRVVVAVSREILGLIAEIDEFKGAWLAIGRLAPERLSRLRHVATIESVGSSTRIEGARLSDPEVEQLLSAVEVGSFATRDEQEVAGYADTMNTVSTAWEVIDLTENHVRRLHRDLLQYSEKDERHRGNYKTLPNHVEAFGPGGPRLGIVFETAAAFDTPRLTAELLAWTRNGLTRPADLHPLLTIAVFIVAFLAIHPFQDGNRRLSRILTTLLLLRAGYSDVPYCSLESIIEQSRDAYYLAQRRTQRTSRTVEPDWDPWLTYFLTALQWQKRHLHDKIERERLTMGDLPELSLRILELARDHGRVTIRAAAAATGASRNTIKDHVRALTRNGPPDTTRLGSRPVVRASPIPGSHRGVRRSGKGVGLPAPAELDSPGARARFRDTYGGHVMRQSLSFTVMVAFLLCASAPADAQQDDAGPWQTYDTSNGEWMSYAGDVRGTKYSPLDQIDAGNFADLEIAWQWTTVDHFISRSTPGGGEWTAPLDTVIDTLIEDSPDLYRPGHRPILSRLQATPLMVDGVLYFNTPLSQGVAVDARTGETLWVYNPKAYEEGTPTMSNPWSQRGVAYWTDGEGDERIFWGTGNGYLICVDAKTGQPCPDFGPGGGGRVDAMAGLPRANREERDYLNALLFGIHSPPIVVRDKVIHGSHVADRRITKEAVPGWVRAWDVRTGEHAWDFHTVPNGADEFGVDTWLNESWRYSGNANVWSMLAGDNELGHVYLPTGTATNDYYGIDRLGDNLFSETLIAVDVETGQREWHFQAVHHGLWDYDFATHPNLVDVVVDGRPVQAIAQVSKQGFVYVFDRVTGDPIWPIEERPVPQETNMPGEVPSPTQPFPTKPAAFDYQGVTIDDLVDFTPEIRQMAIEAVEGFRLGPLFTPLDRPIEGVTMGTIMRPPPGGTAGWSGGAVDPETGMLYVPSRNRTAVVSLYQPDPALGATVAYTHGAPEAERLARRGNIRREPQMPQGLPLVKPPYSRMTAIDLNTGEHAWWVPTGNGDRYRNHPLLRDLNLPPLGGDNAVNGPLLTKTLLIYCLTAGGSDGGPRLVAYDKANGAELASVDLPSGAIGTPMTYLLDGRQYIALTVGGGPRLIAFALPD